MNNMNVPSTPEQLLTRLTDRLPELTPQVRKAATYVLENPNDVSVSSIREIAAAAAVKPNTLVRLARACGVDGYDEFRAPFREQIRNAGSSFPDRARWLQSLSQGGKLGGLYADMARSTLDNVEQTFAAADSDRIQAAADAIVQARQTLVLGVGVNQSLARQFSYLADMALSNVKAVPGDGALAADDIARAKPDDVLLAMTFKPYRSDVIQAVELASERKMTIVAMSDSPASPIIGLADHDFVICTDTPQFFTSIVAATSLLETLIAFVIADAAPDVVANIEAFHEQRRRLGVYHPD